MRSEHSVDSPFLLQLSGDKVFWQASWLLLQPSLSQNETNFQTSTIIIFFKSLNPLLWETGTLRPDVLQHDLSHMRTIIFREYSPFLSLPGKCMVQLIKYPVSRGGMKSLFTYLQQVVDLHPLSPKQQAQELTILATSTRTYNISA